MMGRDSNNAGSTAPSAAAFQRELPIPALLRGDPDADGKLSYALRTNAGSSELIAGLETPTWGYNGSVLGPTLVVPRGRPVHMALTNGLDQSTTVHWHGARVPGRMDGGPHTLIQPGTTQNDHFTLDQPGATLWYHPHPHGRTGPQVYAGLAGLLLVDDGVDRHVGLPHAWGVDDIPLIVQDRRIAADGTLRYMDAMMDIMGMQGDRFLVNGREQPFVHIPAQWIRLRLLNGSNARIYNFSFRDKRAFYAVASDAGLLGQPVKRRALRLFPAERAEILVDLRRSEGKTLILGSYDTESQRGMGSMAMGPSTAHTDLVQLRVGPATDRTGHLPDTLVNLPEPQSGPPSRHFDLGMMGMGKGMMDGTMMGRMMQRGKADHSGPGGMSMGAGGRHMFSINHQFMDMDVINLRVKLGQTEVWRINNTMMMNHSFHLHGASFRILSRNGQLPPEQERGWKDVIQMAPHSSAVIVIHFGARAEEATPYMYHCHMLEHEDNGMMGQFTVT
jgi:blue copper oxidase